jgi:hypothetical protein
LTEVPSDGRIKILFVGHSICLDLHIHLFNELKSAHSIVTFYKPHPTEKIEKRILEQNWKLISDKHFFPKVDFLISYNSTLTIEYQNLGIESIVHPISLKSNESAQFLLKVKKEIDYLMKLKIL